MVSPADALVGPAPTTYDYVLANPPFGKKSSMTFTTDEGEAEGDLTYNRQDLWASTSNKQLNFVQHISHDAEDDRPRRRRRAGQRAVRGGRRRNDPPQTPRHD